jgi:hypothetical protein
MRTRGRDFPRNRKCPQQQIRPVVGGFTERLLAGDGEKFIFRALLGFSHFTPM